MHKKFWLFVGFANTIVFPLTSLLLGTILYVSDNFQQALRLVAVIYPLGLSFLVLFPLGLRPRGNPAFGDYVNYVAGARYGILSTICVVIPVALFWGLEYNQSVIGEALMAATIGSVLLPGVSLAGVQGYLLIKDDNSDRFFDRAKLSPTNSENVAILFLGLFQRIPGFLRRTWRTAIAQLIFIFLYFLSWTILGLAGGFPYTLLGLFLGLLVPLSAFVSFRRVLAPEEREKLSELLIARTPIFHQAKARHEV